MTLHLLVLGQYQSVESSALVVSSWFALPGNRVFLELASMVVTWWIVTLLSGVHNGAFPNTH